MLIPYLKNMNVKIQIINPIVYIGKHHRLFSGVGCARKFWNFIHRFGVVVEGVRGAV